MKLRGIFYVGGGVSPPVRSIIRFDRKFEDIPLSYIGFTIVRLGFLFTRVELVYIMLWMMSV